MSITFVFSCYKVIVFTFMIQEQFITSSFCKNLGWSILIQVSRARLQLDGMAAEIEGFVWQENLLTCNYF